MMWATEQGFMCVFAPPPEIPHLSQLSSSTTKCEFQLF